MQNYFRNKVVIVTGGASGIGEALCSLLASFNSTVIIADINEPRGKELALHLKSADYKVDFRILDVTDPESFDTLLAKVQADYGKIDMIFNNAGVAVAGEARDLGLKDWHRVIDINLKGVVNGTVLAYQMMVKQGHGQIVNIASIAGIVPFPISIPYGTSKFGVIGLSTSLRAEGKELGVKVNTVCPGYIQTNIFDSATLANIDREVLISRIPFRLIKATEAAEKILKGVAKNKRLIIFPGYAKLLYWMTRLAPGLLQRNLNKRVRQFREIRVDQPS